jgi:polysaccharide deacetylase family protein (PEP-CTERM system associated)
MNLVPRSIRRIHALTVDVEEHFHVSAFSSCVAPSDWDSLESRVESNTARLLDVFAEANVKGTFFVLGWVAEKHPSLVRRIQAAGHELACHSFAHRLVFNLTPTEFREDTLLALQTIEDASGTRVKAYRAPSFSITQRSLWAVDILADLGFTQDSSVFPIRHDTYGFRAAPTLPFRFVQNGTSIIEFPMPTIRFGPARLPVSGGGYLRMLPMWFQNYGLRKIESMGECFNLYLHPWEVDPEQPRITAPLRSRIRHYTGLEKTESRLRSLLALFRFGTMSEVLDQYTELPAWTPSDVSH